MSGSSSSARLSATIASTCRSANRASEEDPRCRFFTTGAVSFLGRFFVGCPSTASGNSSAGLFGGGEGCGGCDGWDVPAGEGEGLGPAALRAGELAPRAGEIEPGDAARPRMAGLGDWEPPAPGVLEFPRL